MPAYEAYGIKKLIGKNSIKDLTAKALSVVNEKNIRVTAPKANPESVKIKACSTPISPRKKARITPPDDESLLTEEDDDCEFLEEVHKQKKRRPQLTKAQKAARASSEKKVEAAKRAREQLLKALADDDTGECSNEIIVEPAVSCTSSTSDPKILHERVIVIWKGRRNKFSLLPSESMQDIFVKMAQIMETEVEKIIIFCNSDPSHSVSPFDLLTDIGSERLFQAALKDSTVSSANATIPAQHKIILSVQSVTSKNRIQIDVDRRAPLSVFMQRYCQRMGKKLDDFQFRFDGDILDGKKSANDLDLDGEEIVDAIPV
ncbi:uncharacterized protein LOC129602736 [Paramacrobiotus metropolitanus]|uniref:uncharacterized protein LOC129602736 n=1 Tax=Paramacrobiotus metropolitanus TaxID=2943436 RepID=UPI0024458593|nr:uncharacterized protein LOC129602736 [Paramacrobiotus metropolitanus]